MRTCAHVCIPVCSGLISAQDSTILRLVTCLLCTAPLQVLGAMGPPGGARNPVDPRFISLFNLFEVQFPSTENLRTIYQVRARGLDPTRLP